ncbi:uncharacterized protein LOC113402633 [Vanessa tameamea]|uniref:Uncharacterized protein LOC113402633 n=1 Tax=Vanessa tameamea TaxID=334116 RepID=A0A8B8INL4_VANTA
MDKYYKNFILCGEANFYCILCQEGFEIKTHVEKHLRWEKHRKNIKNQEYAHKFKKDRIYKIADKYFYCEICNLVFQNAAEHIKGNNHLEFKISDKNKERTLNVHCDEDGSIRIQDRVITKQQWHGIVYGMCFICDEPVERILTHIKSFSHMMRLIQCGTMVKDSQLYRQVRENNFYCFTCFKVLDNKSLETHWVDNHNSNKNEINKHKISQENIKNKSNANVDTNNNIDSVAVKIFKKIEKTYFSFEIENKATCLKCQEIVDATYVALSEHKKFHQSLDDIVEADLVWLRRDKGKARAELAKYGRDNFIRLNEGGSKGYCSLCNKWLSAHINIAKQHVEGACHRGHLELKGLVKDQKHDKPTIKSVPYKSFLDTMFGPFEIDGLSFVVINNGICIDTLSYMLICVIDNFKSTTKCFGCDSIINVHNLKKHAKTNEHKEILSGCKVLPIIIKDDDDEFVRQIHPGLYHCGYCNKTFPFWENLMKHLKSHPHTVQRQKSKLISCICAKLYLDPLCSLTDIKEYKLLRDFFG